MNCQVENPSTIPITAAQVDEGADMKWFKETPSWLEFVWQRPFEIDAVWEMLSHLAALTPRGAVVFEARGRDGHMNTVKSYCRRADILIDGATNEGKSDVCGHCGAPLQHMPGKKKKRFCSDKCRFDWWNTNRSWARGSGHTEGSP